MTKKKIVIITFSLVAVTVGRLLWLQYLSTFDYKEQINITDGVLDLRDIELTSRETMRLDGEWAFYPSELLVIPNQLSDQLIQVPGLRSEAFMEDTSDRHTYQYGTYRLRILLNTDNHQKLGLRVEEIRNAFKIYVNGELIAQNGELGEEVADYKAKNTPSTVMLHSQDGEIDLVIQVANHVGLGGISQPIRFGTMEAVKKRALLTQSLSIITSVVFMLHCFYAILLYWLGVRNKGLLYFSIIMVFGTLSVLSVDDKLLMFLLPINYDWSIKITMLMYIGLVAFIPLLLQYIFPDSFPEKKLNIFVILLTGYALGIILSPVSVVLDTVEFLMIPMVTSALISIYILWQALKQNKKVLFLLLSSLFYGMDIVWSGILSVFRIPFVHYPFDLILSIMAISIFCFQYFIRVSEKTKELSKELKLENDRKDEFLIMTSHELKNPLHSIINISQVMLEDKERPLTSKQAQRLHTLNNISNHMSLIVDDLLEVKQIRENTLTLHKANISLSSIINGVNDMIKSSLGDKEIKLQVEILDEIPSFYADEKRLVQVIYNLLHNAVKYTNEGQITTRLFRENNQVVIQVEDAGIGIAEEELSSIFERYKSKQSYIEDASGGLGLGLSISEELINMHGGTIVVHSELTQGSTFTVTLPIESEESFSGRILEQEHRIEETSMIDDDIDKELINNSFISEVDMPLSEAALGNGLTTILIVEDDPVNLNIMGELLEQKQYHIITARNGIEALEIINKGSIDLVVSDVMMPQLSGYELTRRIRKEYSLLELPVLLLTARARVADIITGFQVGANDYVTKPVEAWELRARVKTLARFKIALNEHVRMEAAWLQSQIQPHFIFNTLNTIASLGRTDNSRMLMLLEEYSNFLKHSFDFENSKAIVSIHKELELVRSYAYIEQERFGEQLAINWDIEPNMNFYIPPLSIQPLVENAIIHGILKKESKGTILIKTKSLPDYYEISVIDNGIGMTEQQIKAMFNERKSANLPKSTRVGIRNINMRLKQLYNEELIIESKRNVGTTVRFRIPHKEVKKMCDSNENNYVHKL